MKTLKFTALTFLFLAILPFANARADFFSPYAAIYTVGSEGSTTPVSDFSISSTQSPWLYIELYPTTPTDTSLLTRLTFFNVQDPNNNIYYPYNSSTTNQIWVDYPSSVWQSIKTTGLWSVQANSVGSVDTLGGTANFRVNAAPEPVGTALFLTGGAIMAFGLLRRKKLAIA